MNTQATSLSTEQDIWLTQLTESRQRILAQAQAGQLDTEELGHLAEEETSLALALRPMPAGVVEHLRAAHAHTRYYLERLPQHDPARAVVADPTHNYTPRKILRRVLDHALDHLNQLEQWLAWQQRGILPTPTDGWADSATTLAEDHQPLTQAELNAWLWRIDLTIEMLAQRAEQLSNDQLDWVAPDGGWNLRYTLHHLASAEIFYAVWLDEALPEEPVARYAEANQRLLQKLKQISSSPVERDTSFFQGGDAITIEQAISQAMEAEQKLLLVNKPD